MKQLFQILRFIFNRPRRLLAVVVLVLAAIAAIYVFGLFRCAWIAAAQGEQLAALGSVLGGIIGVFGSAAAVYLTLWSQRQDETDKVSNAIIREVMEFSRFAVGNLTTCENLYKNVVQMPGTDLPAAMQTPEPIVYPAIADRIGRLHMPQRVVAFYTRIAEARRVAAIIAIRLFGQMPVSHEQASKMADIWIDICQFAELIMLSADFKLQIDLRTRDIFVEQIRSALASARKTFPEAESFSEER